MNDSLHARASYSGYIVLSGIWFVLGIANIFILIAKPHSKVEFPIIICFAIGALFSLWLWGFRLIIENGRFRYRDGLYRWHECELDEIENAGATWVKWDVGTKVIKVPRYEIEVRGRGNSILINSKPFTREALRRLNEIMKPMRRPKRKRVGITDPPEDES